MLKNMTPHTVTICDDAGTILKTIESDGCIRLQAVVQQAGEVDGVRITCTKFLADSLPEAEEGVFFIVSQMVKNACPNRIDFLVPTEMVRDADGRIIGCKSLGV